MQGGGLLGQSHDQVLLFHFREGLKEYEPTHDGAFDIFIEYSNEALEDINEVIKHGLDNGNDNDSLITPPPPEFISRGDKLDDLQF